MSNTLKFGGGQWATKKGSTLAYNDNNGNFKPLPFNFERSTGATRVNKEGLIEVVSNNEPRIDFLNDSKGALLLEPSRSNLITYSEDFSQWNVYYGIGGSMNIQSNYGVSPSGKQDSTKITFPYPSTSLYLSIPTNGTYTSTVYVKGVNGQTIRLGLGQYGVGEGELFTLNGEWQRFENTNTDTGTGYPTINTFGASALELEVWGFQVEQGSYATSYIPTNGSVATRVADSSSQTPPNGVIGQTEGSILFDYTPYDVSVSTSEDTMPLAISNNGSISDSIYLNDYNGNLDLFIRVGGIVQAQIQFSSLADNQRFKLGIGYAFNDLVFYVNGVQIDIDTPLSLPTCNQIKLNGFTSNVHINRINVNDLKLYNTRLSNSELQALTS